ncbi:MULTISPECIES: S-ribosylhomocysteine lyase [unclassified Microbacterium]|uniref:S-ribosylhomocysteine lyase n=1 Tax=unclassified Microbacterium TaxID=2609290 RepID=UPI00097E9814|nr:S-ribosylhomocysteine lyase [Microbacterium sp. JB110]RCS61869.1 S-ribosylhomocysteine lyase [Microbacterium sp. JB110]SJM66332.1 S-ribosylhomocysteine lyase / Autoinducer-2 production protein LuxS [Frigoribacterium sp. JB110]
MADVESFALDHTAVHAPYVRRIAAEHGQAGDTISNFDLRLTQPNESDIPTGALHTIEHLLASLLRDHLDGVIDCSPFGCRTGFHLIVWGEPSVGDVASALTAALQFIAEKATWKDVPGVSAVECGNYRDHSLHGAREWAARIVAQGISRDAFSRVV